MAHFKKNNSYIDVCTRVFGDCGIRDRFVPHLLVIFQLDEYHFKAPLACQLAPSSESCPETHLATHRQHPQATLDPHTVWENMAEVQKHMAELDDFPFKAPLAGQLELASGSCLELNLATHNKHQGRAAASLIDGNASNGSPPAVNTGTHPACHGESELSV